MVDETFADMQTENLDKVPESSSTPSNERLYTKDDVAKIVRREVWDTKRKYESSNNSQEKSEASHVSHGMSQEQVLGMIRTEAQKIADENARKQEEHRNQQELTRIQEANKQIAHSFLSQVGSAKAKLSDFEDVVDEESFVNMTHLVPLLEKTGMSGEVLHYLGKNPDHHAKLSTLARENKKSAGKELEKIVNSLKLHEASNNVKKAKEPLDHMQQSSIGIGSGSGDDNYSDRSWTKW